MKLIIGKPEDKEIVLAEQAGGVQTRTLRRRWRPSCKAPTPSSSRCGSRSPNRTAARSKLSLWDGLLLRTRVENSMESRPRRFCTATRVDHLEQHGRLVLFGVRPAE
jgi:hypothetical protein